MTDLFEEIIISGDLGIIKPDPQIYTHAVKLLKVEPSGILFVDDKLANVEAANKTGMNGLVFEDTNSFITQFDRFERTVICARLLELYQIARTVHASDIQNFKVYKSEFYAMSNVYSFTYSNQQYYVTDDYSLTDDLKYIKNVIQDVVPGVSGGPVKNPVLQSDGAIYASGLDGTEYYLWKA